MIPSNPTSALQTVVKTPSIRKCFSRSGWNVLPGKSLPLSPFYRMGNWGTEGRNYMAEVTSKPVAEPAVNGQQINCGGMAQDTQPSPEMDELETQSSPEAVAALRSSPWLSAFWS